MGEQVLAILKQRELDKLISRSVAPVPMKIGADPDREALADETR